VGGKTMLAAATNLVPSAEEATISQCSSVLVDAQVVPELVEMKIIPGPFSNLEPSATSLVPSAEKAMEFNATFGALFDIHVAPESVEIQSGEYPVIGE
jgi:hypothetical protein